MYTVNRSAQDNVIIKQFKYCLSIKLYTVTHFAQDNVINQAI